MPSRPSSSVTPPAMVNASITRYTEHVGMPRKAATRRSVRIQACELGAVRVTSRGAAREGDCKCAARTILVFSSRLKG